MSAVCAATAAFPHASRPSAGRIVLLLTALGERLGRESAPVPSQPPSPAIGALRRRDPAAWQSLFTDEMPRIYRYALSRVGRPGDAEDLASQVFEEAWRNAEHLEDQGLPARAWLFGIARNVISGHRRRLFRRPPAISLEGYDGSNDDPALSADLLDLARSVARLPDGHAEVVSLRFIHGLSLQETAAVLRTTVDGVKGRQARALAALRDLLGD